MSPEAQAAGDSGNRTKTAWFLILVGSIALLLYPRPQSPKGAAGKDLVKARGTVVEKYAKPHFAAPQQGQPSGGETYYVALEFQTRDGRKVRSDKAVSRRLYSKLRAKGPVTVFYDPAAPGRSATFVVAGTSHTLRAILSIGVGLSSLGIGVVLLLRGPRRRA